MKWIFLIGEEKFNINLLKKLKYSGIDLAYDVEEIFGRYCLDYGDEHVFYDIVTDLNDFIEDISIIPYSNPSIVMMTYTSAEIVRNILKQNDFPKDIYIDNDLGLIVSLSEFINLGMPMN